MLDDMRAEFARFIAGDPQARFRIDAALAHVVTKAYQQGFADGTIGDTTSQAAHLMATHNARVQGAAQASLRESPGPTSSTADTNSAADTNEAP